MYESRDEAAASTRTGMVRCERGYWVVRAIGVEQRRGQGSKGWAYRRTMSRHIAVANYVTCSHWGDLSTTSAPLIDSLMHGAGLTCCVM